jgi:hypothetical protein
LLRCSHHRGKCAPHSRASPVFDSIHAAGVAAARSFGFVLVVGLTPERTSPYSSLFSCKSRGKGLLFICVFPHSISD